jgi:hypothetical protein
VATKPTEGGSSRGRGAQHLHDTCTRATWRASYMYANCTCDICVTAPDNVGFTPDARRIRESDVNVACTCRATRDVTFGPLIASQSRSHRNYIDCKPLQIHSKWMCLVGNLASAHIWLTCVTKGLIGNSNSINYRFNGITHHEEIRGSPRSFVCGDGGSER